jgi:hypothetical protein
MFNKKPSHFSTTKKIIAAFGTIFNDMHIASTSKGKLIKYKRVPIQYGPRDKWAERIEKRENLESERIAITLPRMVYEITDISVDPSKKINRTNKFRYTEGSNSTESQFVDVPYTAGFNLSIAAKSETEIFQIVEQILPVFAPDISLRVKGLNGPETKITTVSILLTGVSPSDEYQGSFEERRVIIWDLTFQVKFSYAGPLSDQSVIRNVEIDFIDTKDGDGEKLTLSVGANDTKESYTVTQTIEDILNE